MIEGVASVTFENALQEEAGINYYKCYYIVQFIQFVQLTRS